MKNIIYILISFTLICSNISANNLDSNKPNNITDSKWASLKSVIQQTKFMQNDYIGINGTDSLFGTSMVVEGNRALIGAPGTNGHGVVYVFEHDGNNWNEVTYLEMPGINAGANFGQSVGLVGDVAIVGAPNDNEFGTDSGSVYVFELSQGSWSLVDQLGADDTTTNHQFGTSLAVEAGRMVVGSIYADRNGTGGTIVGTGAIYVFQYTNNWLQTAKLAGFNTNNLSSFGRSISLSGDWIMVGARDNEAYIFKYENSSWDNGEKIISLSNEEGFGYSVSISGNRALIGAWIDNPTGISPANGSAFIYEYNGFFWSKIAQLTAADVDDYYYFGSSVALNGDMALIGATGGINPNNGLRAGATYLFEFTQSTWSQTSSFYATDGRVPDLFGNAVGFWGNNLFIGSYNEDSHGENAGAVYVYEKPTTFWQQTHKLLAQSGAVDQDFGHAVSISGNRAVIGAQGDSENGVYSGAAYVFEYNAGLWGFTHKILPNDGDLYLNFGHDVSLDGGRVLISAFSAVGFGGSAYIFDLTNGIWSQTVKLESVDNEFYGDSVALLGDRAIVGDTGDTINGNKSGSVFIYDLISQEWLESFQLIADDGFANVQFGQSLSLATDRLLVGAGFKVNGFGGSAYIFDFNFGAWTQTDKLEILGLIGDEHYGASVSLSGDRALVGAYTELNNNTGVAAGAAYIFERSGSNWNQVAKLYSSDGETDDLFAKSLHLNGDTAVIGVPGDNDNGTDSGSALIFEKVSNNWIQTNKLLASDGAAGDNFGYSVTFNGNYSLIGANKDDSEFGFDSGAAFIFQEDIIFSNDFE